MKLKTESMKWGLGVALALFALSTAGCTSDKKKASPTDAGIADASADAAITPQACLDQAKALKSQSPQATLDCLCNSCLQEMADCNADKGCVEIRACSDKTGCRGAQDCYLGKGACKTVIDKWGATSLSATLSQQLSDCNAMHCGTDSGVHETCPTRDIMAMGMKVSLSGCCLKNNLCGIMDNFITMSCLDPTALPASYTGGMPIKPQTCDGSPLPMPKSDAGMSMMPDSGTTTHDDASIPDDAGN
jgi:hypothetical protein